MKVEANRPVGTSGVRKDGKTKSAGGFADNLRTEEEAPVAGVTATPVLSGIEALMALQEVPDAMAKRKRALARGDKMLDRLDDLRRGLLLGHISHDKLADLARMAGESAPRPMIRRCATCCRRSSSAPRSSSPSCRVPGRITRDLRSKALGQLLRCSGNPRVFKRFFGVAWASANAVRPALLHP